MKKILTVIIIMMFVVPLGALVDTRIDSAPQKDDVIVIAKIPRDKNSGGLKPDMEVLQVLSDNGLIRGTDIVYDAGYEANGIDYDKAMRDAKFSLIMMVVPKENVTAVTDVLWSYPTAKVETITAAKEALAKTEFTMFDSMKAQIEADIADSDTRAASVITIPE